MTAMMPALLRAFLIFFIIFINNKLSYSQLISYKLCVDRREFSERTCLALQRGNSQVSCVLVDDSADCAKKIQSGKADFGVFTAEEALLAVNFIDPDVETIGQLRFRDKLNDSFVFQTVVVVRSNFNGDFASLRGTNYCHPGFDTGQIWTDRVLKEFENAVIPRVNRLRYSTVNNELYSLNRFFSGACRPGRWAKDQLVDNKLKQEFSSLCQLCDNFDQCSYNYESHGIHKSTLNCLTKNGGYVAYLELQHVNEYFGLVPGYKAEGNASEYKFLCPSGEVVPLNTTCSWIKQPWPVLIASRAKSNSLRTAILQWLNKEPNVRSGWEEVLKTIIEGTSYVFRIIPGQSKMLSTYLEEGRKIPVGWEDNSHRKVSFCVPDESGISFDKCMWLKQAVITEGIEPELSCKRGISIKECFGFVNTNSADIININTDYGFMGRRLYNLSTVVYEDEANPGGNYLIMAVIRKDAKNITTAADLRGKRACFPLYNGLAWLSAINLLKTLSLIPSKCLNDGMGSFFSGLCAPGAIDYGNYTHNLETYCNICKLNGNHSSTFCDANVANKNFGDHGALSCVLENRSDVAFIDYYPAFYDNADLTEKNKIIDSLKVLCRNGTVLDTFDVNEECAIAVGTRSEVLGRKLRTKADQTDYTELLLKMDDRLGVALSSSINLYGKFSDEKDVIFKENTVNIIPVHDTNYDQIVAYAKLQELASEEVCKHELPKSSSKVVDVCVLMLPISLFLLLLSQL